MNAPCVGRWMLVHHAALYDSLFFNLDDHELGYDSPEDFGDPNDLMQEIQADPVAAVSRWSDQMLVRADLDGDPYHPPDLEAEEEMLIHGLSSDFGLVGEDIRIILGLTPGAHFAYFTPDDATQEAVRRKFGMQRDALLERGDGPVHGYGAQLYALRYAWLDLREDGSFTAADLLNSTEISGSWRFSAGEQLELELATARHAARLVRVEYRGDSIHLCTRTSTSVETRVYRPEPPLPVLGEHAEASANANASTSPKKVSAEQWWAYLASAPRLSPRIVGKKKHRPKRKRKAPLILRPRPEWFRTQIDVLALREGPWATAITSLDLCALDLDSERDVKRMLGALSCPREPWASLERVLIPEGFRLEEIGAFMRGSAVYAGVELCEKEE